ncbi:hypothetical protein BKA63DRAFT_39987 [Paraphoma chrysanthemicola]|nr:hypothetical protein BKA63DRAFT_39987 [Paraphoma chrysanthemicola]
MGERKAKSSSKNTKPSRSKMASTISNGSSSTPCSTSGSATLVRCPEETLLRLRKLHEAEIITLFTPFVPHPPVSALAKNMDPFEPLGRALPRHVRHVPFRLEYGMTELHADFLPASGAVVVVICVTDNVLSSNPEAFQQQVNFAINIWRKIGETKSIAGIPAILLLASSEASSRAYADALHSFPALVSTHGYTTEALVDAVNVLFGQ